MLQRKPKQLPQTQDRLEYLTSQLENSKDFLASIDRTLYEHDIERKNESKILYDEWNSNVYDVIKQTIKEEVNNYENTYRSKRSTSFSNTQSKSTFGGSPSRGLLDSNLYESSFDPSEIKTLKVTTKKLKDPLHAYKTEQIKELSIVNPAAAHTLTAHSKSREVLPIQQWASGKIDATSHGVFAKLMDKSPEELKIKQINGNRSNRTTLVLDDFNVIRGKDIVNKEMPRGKRIEPIIYK